MRARWLNIINEEEGASLVEYGLLVMLIAAASVAVLTALGTVVSTSYSSSATSIANAVTSP
jgi:pilus assembly protein Flp/PilA